MARKKPAKGKRPSRDEVKAKAARAEARSKGEPVEKTSSLSAVMDPPTTLPPGRPTRYTETLGLQIGEHIADGLSLRSIEAMPGMPDKKTILRWALEDRGGFATIYARARELQLEGEADEIVDISDDGRNDWMEREVGRDTTIVVLNKEAVDRSKLRVATRQWRLARLMQGKYGDKVENTHKTDESFVALWKMMGSPNKPVAK